MRVREALNCASVLAACQGDSLVEEFDEHRKSAATSRLRLQSEDCVKQSVLASQTTANLGRKALEFSRGAVPCHAPARGRRLGYALLCPWPGVWERL